MSTGIKAAIIFFFCCILPGALIGVVYLEVDAEQQKVQDAKAQYIDAYQRSLDALQDIVSAISKTMPAVAQDEKLSTALKQLGSDIAGVKAEASSAMKAFSGDSLPTSEAAYHQLKQVQKSLADINARFGALASAAAPYSDVMQSQINPMGSSLKAIDSARAEMAQEAMAYNAVLANFPHSLFDGSGQFNTLPTIQ